MLRSALLLLTCATLGSSVIRRARDYEKRDYYVLELRPDGPIPSEKQIAFIEQSLGFEYEEKLGEIENHHVFSKLKHNGDAVAEHKDHLRLVKRDLDAADNFEGTVIFSEKQKVKRLFKRGQGPEGDISRRQHIDGDSEKPHKIGVSGDMYSQLAKELGIRDPIFKDQWHLVRII